MLWFTCSAAAEAAETCCEVRSASRRRADRLLRRRREHRRGLRELRAHRLARGRARVRQRGSWGFATLSYSYYQAADKRVEAYAVPGADRDLLGFARHKATLLASFRLGDAMRLTPSLVDRSGRRAFTFPVEDGELMLEDFDAVAHVNLYWSLRDLAGTGLELGLGVFDLLDEGESFVQP
jgi:hypothetical protein